MEANRQSTFLNMKIGKDDSEETIAAKSMVQRIIELHQAGRTPTEIEIETDLQKKSVEYFTQLYSLNKTLSSVGRN